MEDSLYRITKLVVEQPYLYFYGNHDCHNLGRRYVHLISANADE